MKKTGLLKPCAANESWAKQRHLSEAEIRSEINRRIDTGEVSSFAEGVAALKEDFDPVLTFAEMAQQARAKKAQDEALLVNQKLDLARYQQLAVSNAGSKQQADTQKALVAQQEALIKADQAAIEKLIRDNGRLGMNVQPAAALRSAAASVSSKACSTVRSGSPSISRMRPSMKLSRSRSIFWVSTPWPYWPGRWSRAWPARATSPPTPGRRPRARSTPAPAPPTTCSRRVAPPPPPACYQRLLLMTRDSPPRPRPASDARAPQRKTLLS